MTTLTRYLAPAMLALALAGCASSPPSAQQVHVTQARVSASPVPVSTAMAPALAAECVTVKKLWDLANRSLATATTLSQEYTAFSYEEVAFNALALRGGPMASSLDAYSAGITTMVADMRAGRFKDSAEPAARAGAAIRAFCPEINFSHYGN